MTFRSGTTTLQLPSGGGAEYAINIPATADAPLCPNHLPAPVLGGGAVDPGLFPPVSLASGNLLPPVQMNGGAPRSGFQNRAEPDGPATWDGSGFDAGDDKIDEHDQLSLRHRSTS